jgi:hypothetical protein
MTTYRMEWLYSDLGEGQTPPNPDNFEIHFVFLVPGHGGRSREGGRLGDIFMGPH